MKKLTLFLSFFLFVTPIYSQELFTAPEPDCSHKHQFMTGQVNAVMLCSIGYAKSCGRTLEDVANYSGELFAKTWNKDRGFNGLINGILHNATCFTPGGKVEILEQSGDIVKIKVSDFNPSLRKSGTSLNVTYEEYFKYMKIITTKICEYMGADSSVEDVGEAWLMTITKK